MSSLKSMSWTFRVGNNVVSNVRYIGKTFWSVNLAVFYPYPAAPALSEAVVSSVVIVGATERRKLVDTPIKYVK